MDGTFRDKIKALRKDLIERARVYYSTGKGGELRKKLPNSVHIYPFQEIWLGSLDLSEGYKTVLYNIGKTAGERGAKATVKELGLGLIIRSIIKLAGKIAGPYRVMRNKKLNKVMTDVWERMGYGILKFKNIDEKKREMTITIEECPFCIGLKVVNEKLCYNQAGLLAGVFKGALGGEWYCIETKCMVNGDPHCEFLLKQSR